MFFNYLIEKNEIKDADLMEVLFLLSESQPSLLRVIFEEGVLTPEQILEVVNAQVKESKGLTQVLIEKQYLSQGDLEGFVQKRNDRGQNFGEIITQKALIPSARLQELFGEYTSSSVKKVEIKTKPTIVEELKPIEENKNSSQPTVNAAALESLKELGIEDDSLLAETATSEPQKQETAAKPVEMSIFANELVNSLDEKFFKKIEKISKIIGDAVDNQSDVNTYLNTLYKDFHIVKGAACLAEAKQMEEVLNKWEEVLESLFKFDEEQIRNWFNGHSNILQETLGLLGKMKENIQGNNSLSLGVENEYNQIITSLVG